MIHFSSVIQSSIPVEANLKETQESPNIDIQFSHGGGPPLPLFFCNKLDVIA